jgi:hypothetical protein
MKRNIDIIYFTLFRWKSEFSSISHAFGKELARQGARVFYIGHPFTYKYLLKSESRNKLNEGISQAFKLHEEDLKNVPDDFHSMITPLVAPINWIPPGKLYDYMLHKNEDKIRSAIDQIIEENDIKEYVFINCFNPFFPDIASRKLPPLLNIYQSVDDISQNKYTLRHGYDLEKKIARDADMILVTSTNLKTIMSEYNNNIEILHNAADVHNFTRAYTDTFEKPDEIKHVKGDIIGFTGALDPVRINYGLLADIADTYPDKTLLLVGPYQQDLIEKAGLDKRKNIVLTGSKHISQLPQYVHFMDTLIIPFYCNQLTKSIYPLKINEYLASGRSVISTNFSVDITGFKDVIHLVDSDQAFIDKIPVAIKDKAPQDIEARINVAKTNTWEKRVEQFWSIIHDQLVTSPTKRKTDLVTNKISK